MTPSTIYALLVALLVNTTHCPGFSIKTYEPLPGATAGYIITVTAPPGSRVIVYPSAAASTALTAKLDGVRGGCGIYHVGPISLGEGGRVEILLPNGSRTVYTLPVSSSTTVQVEAPTPIPGPIPAGAGYGAHSDVPRGDTGQGHSGETLVIFSAAVTLFLAALRVRQSSFRHGSPQTGEETR